MKKNKCAVCDKDTMRAVHDKKETSRLIPYCSDCLTQRPIPEPKQERYIDEIE